MTNLIEPLGYGFVQRALLAGSLVAVSCAILGVFLVLRREAMVGHGLAHVTFGGVALALMAGAEPLLTSLGVAILAAAWIKHLKSKAKLGGDTGIGIVASLGMAGGVLLASVAGNFNADLLSYLFGSVLAINSAEVWIAVVLSAAATALVLFFYNELIYATFDEETARTAGVPVDRLDLLIAALSAVTVVVGMKVVGLLLVSALMVMPAASGLISARTFKGAMIKAVLFAVISVLSGLLISYILDWPAGGVIVLVNGIFLGATLAAKA